jgi:hypothetical protein
MILDRRLNFWAIRFAAINSCPPIMIRGQNIFGTPTRDQWVKIESRLRTRSKDNLLIDMGLTGLCRATGSE